METVSVFHEELTSTHEAETRTNLITELYLRLIEIRRKLLVAAQLVAHERRDELLMCGPKAILHAMTIV